MPAADPQAPGAPNGCASSSRLWSGALGLALRAALINAKIPVSAPSSTSRQQREAEGAAARAVGAAARAVGVGDARRRRRAVQRAQERAVWRRRELGRREDEQADRQPGRLAARHGGDPRRRLLLPARRLLRLRRARAPARGRRRVPALVEGLVRNSAHPLGAIFRASFAAMRRKFTSHTTSSYAQRIFGGTHYIYLERTTACTSGRTVGYIFARGDARSWAAARLHHGRRARRHAANTEASPRRSQRCTTLSSTSRATAPFRNRSARMAAAAAAAAAGAGGAPRQRRRAAARGGDGGADGRCGARGARRAARRPSERSRSPIWKRAEGR